MKILAIFILILSSIGFAAYSPANSSGYLTVSGYVSNSGSPVAADTATATVTISANDGTNNCNVYSENLTGITITNGDFSLILGSSAAGGTLPGGYTKLNQVLDASATAIVTGACSSGASPVNGTLAKWQVNITNLVGGLGTYIAATPLVVPLSSVPQAQVASSTDSLQNSPVNMITTPPVTGNIMTFSAGGQWVPSSPATAGLLTSITPGTGISVAGSTVSLATPVSVANGGTGIVGGTSGGIPYFNAAASFASSGVLSLDGLVVGGGAGGAPSTLALGSAGQILTSAGAGLPPTWQTPAAGTVTSVTGGTGITMSGSPTAPVINLSTPVSVANGGTGLSSTTINQIAYSSAANTLSGLPTAANGVLVTSAGGVPSISATLPAVNGSALTSLNASNIASGIVPLANGGTGVSGAAAANGTLLIGNGSGYTLSTLSAGTGISIGNTSGAITITNTGGTSPVGAALAQANLWVGSAGNVAAQVPVSGDVTLIASGATTVTKVDGVSYPVSPGTNTVPVVTAANTVTYETVPVAAGGTGAATLTANGILMGNGVGAVTAIGPVVAGQVLTSQGVGSAPVWAAPGAAPNAPLSGLTAATSGDTLANGNFAQSWNWDTLTTGTAMSMGSASMTTGNVLSLTDSFNSATSTGSLLKATVLGTTSAAVPVNINNAGTGTSLAVTNSGSGNAATFMGGNVGIGTTTPGGLLDLTSTTSGFLMPRMTTVQRTAIVAPSTGLEVYDTTGQQIFYFNGTSWQALGVAGAGITSLTAGTGLTGGTITTSGTIGLGTELTGVNGLSTTGFVERTGAGAYTTVPQLSLTANVTGTLPIANGGTGQITAAAAFNALSPMTTLGDTIYGGAAAGAGTRLAGNITSTKQFLTQTGTGAVSAAPTWGALAAGDLPAFTPYNVMITNISGNMTAGGGTTIGTILTGSATGPTWTTATYPSTVTSGSILYGSAVNTVSALAGGATGNVLTYSAGGFPTWAAPGAAPSVAMSGITAATASNTIANANFAQTWNWDTLTTGTAMSLGSASMTSGNVLSLTDSFNSATSTGNILNVSATGAVNAATGINASTAGTGAALKATSTGTGVAAIITGANLSTLRIVDTNQAAGRVLTSDASGNASWQPVTGTGTVNAGAVNQLAYYSAAGTAVSGDANATVSAGALTLGQAGIPGSLIMNGSTSGTLTQKTAAVVTPYSITWPGAVAGTAGSVITSDTSGNLSFTAALPITNGGTGQITAAAAFNALSPMTTLGDTIYGGAAAGAGTRLAGNITSTKQFLTQTGTGAVSAAPTWGALATGDLPTFTAYNVMLTNISGNMVAGGGTTIGSILTGSVTGPTWTTATYPSTVAANSLLYGSAVNTVSALAPGTNGYVLTSSAGVPTWAALSAVSSMPLSGITAATASNSFNNGTNTQTWNWQLAGNTNAMTIGESAASATGTGTQNLLNISTLAASTANPINVSAHGASAFLVNSSGNVGIGTAAPTSILQVNGTGTGTTSTLQVIGGTGTVNPSNTFSAVMSSSNTTLGNDWNSISAINTSTTVNNMAVMGFADTVGGSNAAAIVGLFMDHSPSTNGQMLFMTRNAGSSGEKMRITNAGNVGIGTTTPNASLDVAGGVRAGAATVVVAACTTGIGGTEGTQRYNYATHVMEYCNGTSWVSPYPPPSTRQILTTSGTYTPTSTGVRQIKVRMVGGGGGGASSMGITAGGSGTATSFNSYVAAGGPGATATGTAGGTGTGGASGSGALTTIRIPGASGSFYGNGGGNPIAPGAGFTGATNTVGTASTFGGSGGSTGCGASQASNAFSGGSSGEYVELIFNAPFTGWTYSVGTGGAGAATGFTGGAGAPGIIIIDEYY